jgi:Zn-finger nucleic acid-binding protein
MPTAETLHCPSCGAAAASDATKCDYCGARLATVACPSCFGMMFVGEKFCSHCGAAANRTEAPSGGKMPCPECRAAMKRVEVGKVGLWECTNCEGLWVTVETLQQICSEKEQQTAVLGIPMDPPSPPTIETKFRYRACPVCGNLMNRINFAHCSGVIIDVCKPHGTWFDKDEMRRVIEFIRSGGMEKARAREMVNLENERERIRSAPTAAIPLSLQGASESDFYNTRNSAVFDIADLVLSLFR